jgi:UDP-N-acetylglucosamine:LPS N-acetylglucosamine transferase
MKEKVVLLIYGSGGHEEQARRIYNGALTSQGVRVIHICEKGIKPIVSTDTCFNLSSKISKTNLKIIIWFEFVRTIWDVFLLMIKLLGKYQIMAAICTGPGICAPFIFLRLFKAKIIFFESWSRHSTRSRIGLIGYLFAHVLIIQNASLLSVYRGRKVKYLGRL